MPVNEGSPMTAPKETNVLQNFTDATAGRSQQLFYGMGTRDSVGDKYVLMKEAGAGRPVHNAAAIQIDLDFDITINKPTILAGIATIDFKFETAALGRAIITLYHYDGATETSLGTVTSEDINGVAIATKLKFTVTRKMFAIGTILRLNIIVDSAAGNAGLYFDALTAGNELKLWTPIVNLE